METQEHDTTTDSSEDAEAAEYARRLVIGTSVARAEHCLRTIEAEATAEQPDCPDLRVAYMLGGIKTALEHLVQEMKPFGASAEEVEQFWAPLREETPQGR